MLMLRLKQQKQIWDHLQCAMPSDKRIAGIVLFNFPATVVTNKSAKIYGMIPAPRNMSSSGEMNKCTGAFSSIFMQSADSTHWIAGNYKSRITLGIA